MNASKGARLLVLPTAGLAVTIALGLALAGCGGGSSVDTPTFSGAGTTSTVTTTISDPPICKGALAPSGMQFNHVWVTITRVRAHISSGADESSGGWVDLADLSANPMQIDLLGGDDAQCILAVLGATSGLPAGTYQQIRLHLLANNPPGGVATPSPNNCASVNGFNCAELADGTLKRLELASQAQTGLKIPPGQIAGGGLVLEAGQTADINIEFNACNSIVQQGNGDLRLKPTLHAGEVSAADTITGRAVNQSTGLPIVGTVIVLAEQPDAENISRVKLETLAAADATFSLCPLPVGNYDIVLAAQDAAGVTYNATAILNVPNGTALGDVPLVPEPGPDTSPGRIDGQVATADGAGMAAGADISLAALQEVTPAGGSARLVTVPLFGSSTPNHTTENDASCPTSTKCANYSLFVPASNPLVGTISSTGTTYTGPAAGEVFYRVNARAFLPGLTDPNCTPPSLTTDKQADGTTALTVTAGATTTAQTLSFTGCQAGN